MKVDVETGEGCRRTLRFDVPPDAMETRYADVLSTFERHAKIKGFRPGKAPRPMVERRFTDEIAEEVREKETNAAFRAWMNETDLDVVAVHGFKNAQWERGGPLAFEADVDVAPEVSLVAYKGIEVRRPSDAVDDAEIGEVIEQFRARQASFEQSGGRPLQMGDYAVVNYSGVIEGKPVADLDPEAKVLSEGSRQWVEISESSFLPGFASQVVGMEVGDRRQANVDIPAEFGRPLLAGKKATYFVELLEIRERRLPEVDDELARGHEQESLDAWRAAIRGALGAEKKAQADRAVRRQVIEQLLAGASFPVPDSLLSHETRRAIYDIVLESRQRGASREAIEERKDELFGFASRSAEQRLRLSYVLRRIADEEKIETAAEDLDERIRRMAEVAGSEPAKVRKELEKRGAMADLESEIRESRALEFVIGHAKVAPA